LGDIKISFSETYPVENNPVLKERVVIYRQICKQRCSGKTQKQD
jgi:hypothetical protein